MQRIGIRELRQNAARYLRLVEGGETVEITDRGRPVALLVPVPGRRSVERLEIEGRLTPAIGELLDLEPLPLPPESEPPSAVLARLREHER